MSSNIDSRLGGIRVLMALFLLVASATAQHAMAQSCESGPTRYSFEISGEVAGEREFSATIADRWTFRLQRIQYGWAIRLNTSSGIDLTSITPPFQFGVNQRDIEGWHFRNRDNSTSNDGSVNAPQRDRVFLFSPSLEGTGGYRPPDGAAAVEFDGSEGRGLLRIHDLGLADLEPGEKARLVYLNFSACLTWPKTEEAIAAEMDYNNLEYVGEELEIILGCGLDAAYQPAAWMRPRLLAGDFDGDGATDHAVQIRRVADGRKGMAICRAGTWINVFGMDDSMAADLPKNGFGALEKWRVSEKNLLSEELLTNPRQMEREEDDDVLILERVEKSQHVIYWHDNNFVQQTLSRLF